MHRGLASDVSDIYLGFCLQEELDRREARATVQTVDDSTGRILRGRDGARYVYERERQSYLDSSSLLVGYSIK